MNIGKIKINNFFCLHIMSNIQDILDILITGGVIAFSISGALTAMEKKLDVIGIFIIAFATATGGGTLRDIMLPNRDVFWLISPIYTYMAMLGTLIAIILRKKLEHLRTTLSLFDTLGLGLYTIIGVEIGIQNELPGISCVVLGAITGAFGGVIRDILVNEVPLVFQKEIYITISILGATYYYFIYEFASQEVWGELSAILIIVVLRLVVVKFEISFPSLYKTSETK